MAAFALLLFSLAQSVLAQDQWRLVYHDGEVASAWGEPRLSPEQCSRLQFAWVWSESRPPRRLRPEALAGTRSLPPPDPLRLHIRVSLPAPAGWGQGVRPPPGRRDAGYAGLRVIAAPLEMWRDLPEDALPSWSLPATGRLAVPLDPARRWRVRVSGQGEGSWWADVPAGRSSVLVALTPAAGIDVLVSGPDGSPLAAVRGALLEGAARGGGNRLWATLRGTSGQLAAPGLPDAEEVALTVIGSGFAPAALRGRPSELPRRLRLGAGASLSGRVTGPAGRPLAAATVRVEAWISPSLPQPFSLGVATRADGGWRLAGLPPGRAALRITAPGYVAVHELIELAAGGNDLGVRTLATAQTVAVLTVDEEGTPVAGAKVDAGSGTLAVSDVQGLAQLGGLPAAPLALTATAPGHLPGKARYNPPFAEPLQVALPRATTLRGRFLEAPGLPVGEGSIRIEQGSRYLDDRLGDGGRFDKDLEPGHAVVLVLRSPATRELRLTVPTGQPGEVRDLGDLLAPQGLAVTGRVVSGRDGLPVAAARVWLPRPGPEGPAVAWAGRDLLQATSAEDGRFRLAGLAPGAAVLRIEAAGFARAHRELSLVAAAAGDGAAGSEAPPPIDLGDIALSAGATLRVVVKGSRAALAQTAPEGAVARADLRNSWLEPDMLTAVVQNGVATLRDVPPGAVTVSVLAGRTLVCEQQVVVVDGEDRDVDCGKAPLTVAGLVRVGGRPSGAGTLIWQPPSGAASSLVNTTTTNDGLRQQQVYGVGRPQVDVPVGGDGTFTTDELSPDRWQVSWVPEQGSAHTAPQTLDIPAVERFDIVLSYAGLALTGRVTFEDGRPAERAQVRELVGGAMAFSLADGSFALAGLPPGKVAVQARLDELSSKVAEAEIAGDQPPEPLHLILGKRSSPAIEVRVLGTSGAPIAGAFVFLEEEGKGQRILTTDAEGKASASIEPPLAPRVRPAVATGNGWIFGGWVPAAQAQDEGLTVQSGPAGSLLLTSAAKSGSPRIVSDSGWDLSQLMRQLGATPLLTPGRPLRLDGLPVGSYNVSLDGASLTVVVTADAPVEARLK
ncbi:MAG TPA: carboxypeptidase-like regulatory domain-containing protein [Thermoanaerobaculia bacterium]|nr:carboxypeptidase-like regulatory domain-containing protein [Thermoanaerobaculia bacterium]